MIQIVNKMTGEVVELNATSAKDILFAYRQAKEFEDMGKRLRDKIKPLLDDILDEQGRSPAYDGYIVKSYESQRMTYSKSALREVFDEDELDLMLDVSKGSVDKYLKENNLSQEQVDILKRGLVPNGKVVSSYRLERVE